MYNRDEPKEGHILVIRKRKLVTEATLFIMLDIMGDESEDGEGIEHFKINYGISMGTTTNYFRHALFDPDSLKNGIQLSTRVQ